MKHSAAGRVIAPGPDFSFESLLWDRGVRFVAGVDEAGRGALAGPVAAGVIVFDIACVDTTKLSGVRDSKKMTARARSAWASRLPGFAISSGVGFASAEEIDRLHIVPATRLAIQRALEALSVVPEHILIDYLVLPEIDLPQTTIVKGDNLSLSIAAAAVLAKTARDQFMIEQHRSYPEYAFHLHKGYGTLAHRQAIIKHGPCPIHRYTFAPLKDIKGAIK